MRRIILSPSLLGYEKDLLEHEKEIESILSSGIEWLHVDVMKSPFVPNDAFSYPKIFWLYTIFKDHAKFDFHLMDSNPLDFIDYLARLVKKKEDSCITIHREAMREYAPIIKGGLGEYAAKEHDLPCIKTGDSVFNENLIRHHWKSTGLVVTALDVVKDYGFMSGIALEPGTSLENLTEAIMKRVDFVLLMAVRSGAGGQAYNSCVTEKISSLKTYYPKVPVQVDGGINDTNILEVAHAGADNIVVGSYITGCADPSSRVMQLKKMLDNI